MSISPQGASSINQRVVSYVTNTKESWALIKDLALYNNKSWNDPRDFAKPVKAISLPRDVPNASDRHLIELENQVQHLMEAHLAPKPYVQVNKIASLCEICSGPYDTQYWMENPEQAFVDYASSHIDEARDARLFKLEPDFKQQQSEMTNKIDTFLKAINDQMTGALPSDTVKNSNLNINLTSLFLSARSYLTEDPQSSSRLLNSVNSIKTCFKPTNDIQKDQLQVKTLTVNKIETPKPKEPEKALENEFKDLHLKLPVLKVLAHAPMYNAILDKYVESLELVQVEELKSVNESLNLTVKELYKARVLAEASLRERDELIYAQCKKIRLLEEQSEIFHDVPSNFDSETILDQEMKQQIILFEVVKRIFLAKNEFLEKVSSSVQKEYNGLLASNDVLKQRLETKFKFLKHDNSLEKMFEMIEQEYESNVSKIFITSSTIETKNLELVKKMGDKVKRFDDEKIVFENKISKMKKDLAQRVKDFDDVKTELSRRTDKFETYFANLEKENALLKSQLASQNYTSLQKENNDLRTSYNVLKEKYEISCAKLKKENNDLKMHYKRLFDSIKQKKVAYEVFTKSVPKVSVSEKIYTGKSLKPISKKVSQFTTYSLQKDRKYLKKQHSSETFVFQNHVKNKSSKQTWKSKENISKRFKYSRDEMFSMRKRDDSILKKVKDVRFPFISKRFFHNETPSFNNK
nr:outer membrane protein porin [Tanacetum cinerariifolium]